MGALHEGHLSLVKEARNRADFTVVSIFVNPTQFAPGEDFELYPRDLDADAEKLSSCDVDLIFAPCRETMYLPGHSTQVTVSGLTEGLCGKTRPGHFSGVTTVVAKLFNIIGPCVGIFGRKDYQQLQVIQKMVTDLNIPVEIVGLPTHREPDGLAMSSRNAYLSPTDRHRALALSKGLGRAQTLYRDGERQVGILRGAVVDALAGLVDDVDYVTAADGDTLAEMADDAPAPPKLLIAIAAKVGHTRLIDNTVLGEDAPLSSSSR